MSASYIAETIGPLIPVVTASTFDEVAPSPSPPMATVTTNQSTGLSTYTNELYGITFDFPADWRIDSSFPVKNQLLSLRPSNDDKTGFSLAAETPTTTSYLDPTEIIDLISSGVMAGFGIFIIVRFLWLRRIVFIESRM